MSNARNLARLVVDSNGDVAAASLDNVPASDDASALTTGTLDIARIGDASLTAAKLASTLDLSSKTVSLASSALPAGSVLQVARSVQPNNVTSTSTSMADAITASITPQYASSKILITAMAYGAVRRDQYPMVFQIELRRNGSYIGSSQNPGLMYSDFETANATKWVSWQDCVLDTPNSTSEVTYSIAFGHTDQNYGGYSPNKIVLASLVLLLMEIAA